MKNRTVIALLTIIAVLLGANLVVATAGTTWAQDRGGGRPTERQPAGDEKQPTRGQAPQRGTNPERRTVPQRQPRCVGITSVGNVIVLAYDDGSIARRDIPEGR